MFLDRTTLHSSLFGLVGFHKPTNPSYNELAASLLVSRSSTYYNDAHALLSIENIDQSIKNFGQYNYTPYAVGVENTLGVKRSFDGINYEYINATPSTGTPPPNATFWAVIDETSDYLIKAVYAGIDRMLDKYVNGKQSKSITKSIFENVLLYNGAGDLSDIEANVNNFVGIRLRFKKKEKNLVGIINKIGYQFDAAFTGLDIKLYHDSQQEALATFTVDQTGAKSFQWVSLSANNILRYVDTYDAGGDFYLGYKQSDLAGLSASAINKNVSWNSQPVSNDDVWRSYYQQYSSLIDIMGFAVPESEMPLDAMFNPLTATLTPVRNYGLNLNLTAKNDLTTFFLQEETAIAQALKYNVAMVLMEALAYNTRGGNQIANQVRVLAEKQLFHHKEAFGTLADNCSAANKSLSFDFSDMDNSGMPKDDKTVLRIKRGAF